MSSSVSDFAQLDGRYYDSMIAAYCKGIVYGDDKGNLNPKSSITRAEACAIIMRAASMKGDLNLMSDCDGATKTANDKKRRCK